MTILSPSGTQLPCATMCYRRKRRRDNGTTKKLRGEIMLALFFPVAAAPAAAVTPTAPPPTTPDAHVIQPGDELAAVGVRMSPCSGFNAILGRDPQWAEDTYS